MNPIVFFMLFLSVLFNSGCALREIVYRNADYLLKRRINAAFDLNSEQKKSVESQLATLLQWHQKDQLAQYSVFLGACAARLDDGLQKEDIEWVFLEVSRFRLNLLKEVYPPAAIFLASLESRQIEEFTTYQLKSNQDRFELLLEGNINGFQKKTSEKTKDQLEEWVGALGSEQKNVVENWSVTHSEDAALKMKETIKKQSEFRGILAQSLPAEDLEKALWTLTPVFDPSQAMDSSAKGGLYLALSGTLTVKQLSKLKQRILDWKKSADVLAR